MPPEICLSLGSAMFTKSEKPPPVLSVISCVTASLPAKLSPPFTALPSLVAAPSAGPAPRKGIRPTSAVAPTSRRIMSTSRCSLLCWLGGVSPASP